MVSDKLSDFKVRLRVNVLIYCKLNINRFLFHLCEKWLLGSAWKNLLSDFTDKDLHWYAKAFYPKYVRIAKEGTIENHFRGELVDKRYRVSFSDKSSELEIRQFSDFVIKTFYHKFSEHFGDSAINRFLSEQKAFFLLNTKMMFNFYEERLVGCVLLGKFDSHPYFKEPVWICGYWGMDKEFVTSEISEQIKFDWAEFLREANGEAPVVAMVDYFNMASFKFSEKLNFETLAVRLDPS